MSCPTLLGRPAGELFILFEPALDMREGEVAYWCFGCGQPLALIPAFVGCWLLLQKPSGRIAGDIKVASRGSLAFPLDEHSGSNFISK
jgi:hypothetical protein